MKIALVTPRKGSAIHGVMSTLKTALDAKRPGCFEMVTIDSIQKTDQLEEYDIVHLGHPVLFPYHARKLFGALFTCNVWHVALDRIIPHREGLALLNLSHIFVDDLTTLQMMGQFGYTSVTLVPLPFDPTPFENVKVERPHNPYTVGVFAELDPSKRIYTVINGAKEAGVACIALCPPRHRGLYTINPVEDFYKHIDVYVHASFLDTNSLPAMEAAACGIPVISTRNYGLERIQSAVHWFDGSVEHLAETIKAIRGLNPALDYVPEFPSISSIANQYLEAWDRLLEECV